MSVCANPASSSLPRLWFEFELTVLLWCYVNYWVSVSCCVYICNSCVCVLRAYSVRVCVYIECVGVCVLSSVGLCGCIVFSVE